MKITNKRLTIIISLTFVLYIVVLGSYIFSIGVNSNYNTGIVASYFNNTDYSNNNTLYINVNNSSNYNNTNISDSNNFTTPMVGIGWINEYYIISKTDFNVMIFFIFINVFLVFLTLIVKSGEGDKVDSDTFMLPSDDEILQLKELIK